MPESVGSPAVRPEVLGFKPYVAGRAIEEIQQEYGLTQVVKLASNENPLGTSPRVLRVLRDRAELAFRYPQSGNPRLVQAIADHTHVRPERIVAGNGSDEIIDLIIRVKAVPGRDNICTFRPCFAMYELQAKLCGVEFRQTPLNDDMSFPWDAWIDSMDENTAVAFLTSPDNPSGFTVKADELAEIARRVAKAAPNALLVMDEAYIDFCRPLNSYSLVDRLDEFPNVGILRTFSKMYGLAGLRLGYGILPPEIADFCRRVKPPFSVNLLAEEAGIEALRDTAFIEQTYRVTAEGREYLNRELSDLGFGVHPSLANFLLVRLTKGLPVVGTDAAALVEKLLAKGVIVRPLSSGYDMPDCVRVSVGNPEENSFFIARLKEILANG